jgi:teichuronic acid biosynthesis glycosyltransferase TuaC
MKVLVVTNMYPDPEQPAFGTFVKDQVESLKRAGIEVDVLFVNGRRRKLDYLWGIFRFWWLLLKNRYDIIHAHYAITGLIARLQFLYPIVVTYHGGEVKDHVPRWLKYFALRGPQMFSRVIVVNRQEKEIISHDAKVRVIPCGVNLDVFRPTPLDKARRVLGLPMGKPLVLWAGEYWQYEKRFELVEASLMLLQQHCPEAELVLVSGKPHAAIPVYMSACDALVLTSRSEGSPMVIKEAMACNLPIVSTDVGDVAEIIEGVEGCYLVNPDPEDVADKLLRVLQWHRRTEGRDKIRHLGSDLIAQRIIAVYHELCPPERCS